MPRSQFTFTFRNAEPGASVTFSDDVYSSQADQTPDGPALALDASRTVAVWADVTELIATWVDGSGASIDAEATVAIPVVVETGGVAGSSPAPSGGSSVVGVGDSLYLNYNEERDSTATDLIFTGHSPTLVGDTFSLDPDTGTGAIAVATGGVIAVTYSATVVGATVTAGHEGTYVEAQASLYNGNANVTDKTTPIASPEDTVTTCVLVALVEDGEKILFTHYHEDDQDPPLGVNITISIQKIA
jgi:hypothetical protein